MSRSVQPRRITRDALIQFARAEARSQRRSRLAYQSDAEVAATFAGWLRCNALFFGPQSLGPDDFAAALAVFRRTRRLPARRDHSQQTLILHGVAA